MLVFMKYIHIAEWKQLFLHFLGFECASEGDWESAPKADVATSLIVRLLTTLLESGHGEFF